MDERALALLSEWYTTIESHVNDTDLANIRLLIAEVRRLRAVVRTLLDGIEQAYESEGYLSGITDEMLTEARAALAAGAADGEG